MNITERSIKTTAQVLKALGVETLVFHKDSQWDFVRIAESTGGTWSYRQWGRDEFSEKSSLEAVLAKAAEMIAEQEDDDA